MAHDAHFYGLFFKSLSNKEVDMDSDQLKAMLFTSTYAPNKDTHQYKSSVTNEVVGTGYTAGGVVIPTISLNYDAAADVFWTDGADISFGPNLTLTAGNAPRGIALYDNTPATDATRPLVGYVIFRDGANNPMDVPILNGTLAVAWDPSGIGRVTVS